MAADLVKRLERRTVGMGTGILIGGEWALMEILKVLKGHLALRWMVLDGISGYRVLGPPDQDLHIHREKPPCTPQQQKVDITGQRLRECANWICFLRCF
jgi:hypothetical protein